MRRTWRLQAIVLLVASMLSMPVAAQVRAWLDRDRIELGQTATLNVESTGNAAPDYVPLLADFDLSGHSSRQQFEWVQGRMQARSTYAVVLRPRGTGLLRIPALRVGSRQTAPLALLVTAPSAARTPRIGGRNVFIETEADDQDPYVQQAVGWTVRLYALPALVSGRLDLEAPPGASLQRIGDDVQYRRDIGGRTWQVIERRYLLIPERSGELAMPPARFEGRAVGNVFDRLFGDGQIDLSARATPRVLRVRPIPANAPVPWLPLHAVSMEYRERPRIARAGEAATLVVQVLADGASRAQMPDLEMPAPAGAEVFAERAEVDEVVVEGRPRVRLTRRFSIVPSREGPLRIVGPELAWWDVRANAARVARLPPIDLVVAPGTRAVDTPPVDERRPVGIPGSRPVVDPRVWWALAALAALALVVFGLQRRRAQARASTPVGEGVANMEGPSLSRALAMGDLADIEAALRSGAPVSGDLDTIAAALADDDQRDAVHALRAARWGGADAGAARTRLREAFARGPRWRARPQAPREPLPPLYPR